MLNHISVLLKETIESLNIKPDGIYVDATFGFGGHSKEILKKLNKNGLLIAFDHDQSVDPKLLVGFEQENFKFINENFNTLDLYLNKMGINKIDGIIFDFGMSSMQIDNKDRGFSYMQDGNLDMRMDRRIDLTAKYILNEYSHDNLLRIFRDYGDINKPHLFSNFIIKNRPYNSTFDLVKITDLWVKNSKSHSAKKAFQALRIEVNNEVDNIKNTLEKTINFLKKGARLVAISFYSLEDKVVKKFIEKYSEDQSDKKIPLINQETTLKKINRKPIRPSSHELSVNSRSHSAIMRVAEKL